MTDQNEQVMRVELATLLDGLLSECAVRTAVVVTRDGSLVTSRGDTSYLEVTALAALLGAMFSATREVARMVGEKHFSILLQQGEKRHIHISLASNDFMVACIFEDVAKIGILRTMTRRVAPRIAEIAGMSWRSQEPQAPATGKPSPKNTEFREYALDLIDRIFSS